MNEIIIRKNNGDEVRFDIEKLKSSLVRSGASEVEANNVAAQIQTKVQTGMTTHNIYKLAYSLLRKQSNRVAGRYKLKKAIFELGPTGYPFERLVSELVKLQGFDTKSGIILPGKCVQHEVDVYARKHNETIFVECKFHNEYHRKTDLKVSMYVKSRFEDLKAGHIDDESSNHKFKGWLVTNTRFSSDAISFGSCAGLKLISWDYPHHGNLRQMIDESGFHPITTMKTLTKKEKQSLLEKDVILCRHLLNSDYLMAKLGMGEKKIKRVLSEAEHIIGS